MGWAIAFALAGLTFAAVAFALKLPRGGREFVGAALLLGLAGYALQGSPREAGSPTLPRESVDKGQAALVAARQEMGDQFGAGRNYLITADAFVRAGQYGAAAELLRGAARKTPNDPDVWLALGNALVGHRDGIITPAAMFAFRRAAAIAPDHPGPPFFTGLALAQSGQFEEARALWQSLMDRPGDPDAPWRADLAVRMARLDAIISMENGGAVGPRPGAQPSSGPVPVEQENPGSAPESAPDPAAPGRPGT